MQCALVLRVEEGLHAEAVARGEQALVAGVPDDEGELAAQAVEALGAEVLVQVEGDLTVGLRAEAVAARLELRAQPLEVIELAVVHDHQRAVLVGDRLVARREVDDGEAGMAEPKTSVGGDPVPASIGAAMMERRGAGVHHLIADVGSWGEHGGDTTHR